MLASRCLKIGLHYMTEAGYGRVVATGVACGLEADSHKAFLEHVRCLKDKVKTRRKSSKLDSYYTHLPPNPRELPGDLFQNAFQDETLDPVSEVLVTAALDKTGTLRKSKKALEDSTALVPWTASSSSSSKRATGEQEQAAHGRAHVGCVDFFFKPPSACIRSLQHVQLALCACGLGLVNRCSR